MKPRGKKAVNLPFISVGMSPLEILTHQIDSCLEQRECGPKGLRSRLGRERRHEVTLRFSCEFGNRTACRCSDGFRPRPIRAQSPGEGRLTGSHAATSPSMKVSGAPTRAHPLGDASLRRRWSVAQARRGSGFGWASQPPLLLPERLAVHTSGGSIHTVQNRPWELIVARVCETPFHLISFRRDG